MANIYVQLIVLPILIIFLENVKSEEKIVYSSYQHTAYCTPAREIEYPQNQDEVVKIVRDAISQRLTVKAFGSRHSMTDIICTNGIPICMHKLANATLNNETNIVTVEAGMTLRNLTKYLNEKGRALKHIPTFQGITIGGAIGTGAHGSSLKHNSSISDFVVGVKIVDGFGNIREIDDPEELRGFKVHLGLLGVILEIQLQTVEQFKLNKTHWQKNDEILDDTETIMNMALNNDMFEFWWFPSFEKVVFGAGNYTNMSTEGSAKCNYIPGVNATGTMIFKAVLELTQATRSWRVADAIQYYLKESLYQEVVGRPHIFAENNDTEFVNPAVGLSHDMMSSYCEGDQCIWNPPNNISDLDNSLSMDIKLFPDIIQNVREVNRKVPGNYALSGLYFRFSLKSDALKSKSFDRNSVHVEWISIQRENNYDEARLGLASYQALGLTLSRNFDGRAHWGKNGAYYHTTYQIHSCYCQHENHEKFQAIKAKYDPNHVFMNKFGARVFFNSTEHDLNPHDMYHCGLADSCVDNQDSTRKCDDGSDYSSEDIIDNFNECRVAGHCYKDGQCDAHQDCDTIQMDEGLFRFFNVCRDKGEEFTDPYRAPYWDARNNFVRYLEEALEYLQSLTTNTEKTTTTTEKSTTTFLPISTFKSPLWK